MKMNLYPNLPLLDYSTDPDGWYATHEVQESISFWLMWHNTDARRRVREAIHAYRQMVGARTVPLYDVLLLAIKAEIAQQPVSRFTYG